MSDSQKASAVRRKRAKAQGVGGKPTNVSTKPKNGVSDAWTLWRQEKERHEEEEADDPTTEASSSNDATAQQGNAWGCDCRSEEEEKEVKLTLCPKCGRKVRSCACSIR